jgi:hypothetical protein
MDQVCCESIDLSDIDMHDIYTTPIDDNSADSECSNLDVNLDCSVNDDTNLHMLPERAVYFETPQNALTAALKLLHHFNSDLPRDARSLLGTPRHSTVRYLRGVLDCYSY